MVELGVNVTPHQAYKCKKLALEDETGNADFQYSFLWDYAQEIRRTNPGSTILIGTDNQHNGPVLFDRMYICLNACKVGFCRGCRPLIGVYGTHLKGPHGGILLTAVGVDPNNNIFPIAYEVVDAWYKVDTYKMVYENSILPINGKDEWEPTGITPPLPPKIGRQAGRPHIARRRESDEPVEKKRKRGKVRLNPNPHKLKRRQGLSKCNKCHKPGQPVRPKNLSIDVLII
ncbi:hypothetical protein ACS0TY_013335 [Phlomoides rotata]